MLDSWAVPTENTTWMDGTFVPEEYVHIRGYYDLIDLKKKTNPNIEQFWLEQ